MSALTWIAEKRKVKDLKALDKNPRKITKAAIEKMKDRISKRGFHDVLKLDQNGVVLSGNVRTEALTALKITEVNVLVPSRPLTEEERKGVILESNRHDGEWDTAMLPEYGQEILLDVGFETMEVDTLMHDDEDEEDPFDTDKTLENIKKPNAKQGDVYKLGVHTVMCGDSTKPEDLKTLLGGVKADMVFTDPPYNMNYVSHGKGGILNDHMEEEKFITFCEEFMARLKEGTRTGGVFYICSGYQSYMPFVYAMKVQGLNFAGPIIWAKKSPGMGMNDYRHQHEMIIKVKKEKEPVRKKAQPILYGWNGGRHYFVDTREEADVWNIGRVGGSNMVHPTQKPIALINRAIKNSSKRGGVILDLFGGSGATLIAAEKTSRVAYLCELDPKYVDVIIRRWEALTGERAVLVSSAKENSRPAENSKAGRKNTALRNVGMSEDDK